MSRRAVAAGLLVVVIAVAVVVVPRLVGRGTKAPRPGTIVLDVGGRYRSTMTLAAVVNWCPVSRVAALEAISVDTGFAIALHENDSIVRGAHPVFAPDPGVQLPKPSATAAFRWLRTKDTTVVVYRSVNGHVDIDATGATLSGSLVLHLYNAIGKDSLPVTGRFSGLKVVAMAAGCT